MQFQVQAAAHASVPANLIQNLLKKVGAAAMAAVSSGPEAAAEEPCCCGWFDSSYELSAGLEVIEESKDLCFAD